MTRSLALIAALAFGASSGVAFAAGDCGSYHVGKSSAVVASADGQGAPSTQIQVPKQKGS